ncbi:MAG: YitT family protein [Alicyclobacillus sp.]|nr:YitT family protein [Alicyclobacillus sp.]
MLIGCLASAVSVNSFLVPAHILAGGVTGVAQIIYHFVRVPIGTMYFLLNIPLFFIGYRYLGRRFILLTAVGIVGFSVFTDWVHPHFRLPVTDPLIMSLYGGVLSGIASGLIIRVGGSAGGTDILSLVFSRLTGRTVGSISFGLNVVIVLASMTVFGIDAGLYTLVAMFTTARVMSALLSYQNRKTALIVSAKADEISAAIGARLGRGSTLLNAAGSYTKADTKVLMCTLTNLELTDMRELCTAIDPHVFITVLPTTEVYGQFRHPAV